MRFKEFESRLADITSKFLEEYATSMRDEPEVYPSELRNEADWLEQFEMWLVMQ